MYRDARKAQLHRDGGLDMPPFLSLASPACRAAAAGSECGDYHTGLAHAIRDFPTQVRMQKKTICNL